MDLSNIDFIAATGIAVFGFAVGWGASWASAQETIRGLRVSLGHSAVALNDRNERIRAQGRTIAEHVAAEQSRRAMLSAAGRKGAAASNGRRKGGANG